MDKLLSWIITTTSAGEKIKMLVTDFYPYRQVSILGFFTIKLLISVNSYYRIIMSSENAVTNITVVNIM